MKVLLIGANGQLGTDLCAALSGHDVIAAIQPGTDRAALARYKDRIEAHMDELDKNIKDKLDQ